MSAPAGGLFESLRRLLQGASGIVLVRLELFGTELEQERQHLISSFMRAALGLLLVGMALVMAIGFVLLLLWDSYRLPAMAVLAVLLGAAGLWMLHRGRTLRDSGEPPFALTLAELRRDGEALVGRDPDPPP